MLCAHSEPAASSQASSTPPSVLKRFYVVFPDKGIAQAGAVLRAARLSLALDTDSAGLLARRAARTDRDSGLCQRQKLGRAKSKSSASLAMVITVGWRGPLDST
jgi:hypothetical protein